MVGGGGEVAQGYEFTKRATRFESSFADGDGDSAKGAVPITVLPDKVRGVGDWRLFYRVRGIGGDIVLLLSLLLLLSSFCRRFRTHGCASMYLVTVVIVTGFGRHEHQFVTSY